jgi:hypothetical protein
LGWRGRKAIYTLNGSTLSIEMRKKRSLTIIIKRDRESGSGDSICKKRKIKANNKGRKPGGGGDGGGGGGKPKE